jgi:hypothetical protein
VAGLLPHGLLGTGTTIRAVSGESSCATVILERAARIRVLCRKPCRSAVCGADATIPGPKSGVHRRIIGRRVRVARSATGSNCWRPQAQCN